VYGMRHAATGSILVNGKAVRPASPRHARKLGIALLPSDRKRQGMFAFQPISFNISIAHLRRLSKPPGWLDRAEERRVSRSMIERLAVRTPSERQPINAMSGGNAQKVVLARQLVDRPDTLVLVEPTQGVDVGAKDEIHRIVSDLAEAGTAVLVVTSDLPEALRISDRLLVVRAGRIVAEFAPDATQVEVLAAAAGGEEEVA
ncbi:MAG: ATP-binding cassette domain-containing protein, partial [Nocardioidaceae bacterium]